MTNADLPLVGNHRLGYIRDPLPPAERGERLYRATRGAALPRSSRLVAGAALPIRNQGQEGSCCGFATSTGITLRQRIQGAPEAAMLSALWAYYAGRAVDGTIDRDAGTSFRSVFTGLEALGFVSETAWPYSDAKTGGGDGAAGDPFRLTPGAELVRQAADLRPSLGSLGPFGSADSGPSTVVRAWQSVDDLGGDLGDNVCHAIAIDFFPVCIGIDVDAAFEAGDFDPAVALQVPTESAGMHAMLIEGYETIPVNGALLRRFLVRNSWGADFGLDGYVWLDESYVRTADLYLVEHVPQPQEAP